MRRASSTTASRTSRLRCRSPRPAPSRMPYCRSSAASPDTVSRTPSTPILALQRGMAVARRSGRGRRPGPHYWNGPLYGLLGAAAPFGGPMIEGGRALSGFTVELDVYSGPYEWLLALILRDEVEIFEVPLRELVDLYLQSKSPEDPNSLDRDTDFAGSAAALILLKSRTLTPSLDTDAEGGAEEPISPEELAERLSNYLKIRRSADTLGERFEANRGFYSSSHSLSPRPGKPEYPPRARPAGHPPYLLASHRAAGAASRTDNSNPSGVGELNPHLALSWGRLLRRPRKRHGPAALRGRVLRGPISGPRRTPHPLTAGTSRPSDLRARGVTEPRQPSPASRIEAILLVSPRPVSPEDLSAATGLTGGEVEEAASNLELKYSSESGILLRRVAGGFQLSTNPSCAPAVELFPGRVPPRAPLQRRPRGALLRPVHGAADPRSDLGHPGRELRRRRA